MIAGDLPGEALLSARLGRDRNLSQQWYLHTIDDAAIAEKAEQTPLFRTFLGIHGTMGPPCPLVPLGREKQEHCALPLWQSQVQIFIISMPIIDG
jgi:hypothetical protein